MTRFWQLAAPERARVLPGAPGVDVELEQTGYLARFQWLVTQRKLSLMPALA
jgi:hypothetical protein